MIVYAVFEVDDLPSDRLQSSVEIKRLIALRSTRMGADEVASHSIVYCEVEEWEVLE